MERISPFTVIIAIDPGPEQSAIVQYRPYSTPALGRPISGAALLPNASILAYLHDECAAGSPLAIEMIAAYGRRVGAEVFETCVWIGKFLQKWYPDTLPAEHYVYRRQVKKYLCNCITSSDADVRQALLDKFGPGRTKAVGTKKCQGPLYGLKTDMWQALAVGVCWADTRMEAAQTNEMCEAVNHGQD